MVGAWKDDETLPDALISLEEIVESAKQLALPSTKSYEAECPKCEHHFDIEVDAPPNQKMVEFLLKRIVGDATKTINTTNRNEDLVRVMSDQRIVQEIHVIDNTPEQRAERIRRAMIEG